MKKLLIALLIGFGIYGYIEKNPGFISSFTEEAATSGQPLAAAYEKRQSDVQVGGSGRVTRVLPDDNEGSRHQRFIIRLSSGQTLLIAHNIDLASRINSIREGDTVDFFGEYEWNSKGGVVHWTHNDPNGRHEDGWLKHKGRIYQ
ncbi:MAG: DUF3465 domain-containing protein [Gammaproteobacteria bacterium]|nr:DUF3465 domain-containing protein [Gammaproteobacteria bacterium]